MLSVCALPMSGGLVATVMTGSLPTFLQSDVVIPTYAATYLLVHNFGILRGILGMVPTQLLDLVTLPADAILKAVNVCAPGVDGITSHYSAAVKHNWFAPIFVGGSVGNAGYLAMTGFNLFSPTWTLNTRMDVVEWDLYGPYLLAFMYLALQGTNPQINALIWSVSQGVLGGRNAKYFTKQESQALVILVQMGVQTIRSLGIYSFRLPGGFYGGGVPAQRRAETRSLGGASKKEL